MAVQPIMTWTGITKVNAKLIRMGAAMPSLTAQAMFTSAMAVLIPAMKAKLQKNRSIFRGEVHQRLTARVKVSAGGNPSIDVGAIGVPYGLNLEKGAAPHKPNKKKIREYVKKKMGVSDVHDVASRTAAIMATIQRVGTKPHPFVMPVFNALQNAYVADVMRRIRAALKI